MTPPERAENLKPKLLQLFRHTTDVNSTLMDIAAQIEEAEREAYAEGGAIDNVVYHKKSFENGYAEGLRAANEETKDVVTWAQCVLTAWNVGNLSPESLLHKKLREVMIHYREKIAQRIGEMEP